MIEDRKNINMNVNTNIIQNLVLENRKKLSVSGVNDVLSFDDQVVMVDTELGLLTVKGENIRINKNYYEMESKASEANSNDEESDNSESSQSD